MPFLDVSEVLGDPELADTFNVTRRRDVLDGNGRTTPTVEGIFTDIVGVVTQQDPSDLLRTEDGQIVPRRIFIATTFQVIGASEAPLGGVQYQPDVITWNGSDYLVTSVMPYSRYGNGMYEVVATSTRAIDFAQ